MKGDGGVLSGTEVWWHEIKWQGGNPAAATNFQLRGVANQVCDPAPRYAPSSNPHLPPPPPPPTLRPLPSLPMCCQTPSCVHPLKA